MPGKQMAIDADLNAGQITEEEARQRRDDISREADFYGAMDGASKFVKGDAIAAILITLINLIGGIIIGVAQMGMPFSEAAQHFSLLTIGDGLTAQIPALLISVATGILVTRAASDTDLGSDVADQITSQKKAPLVAGVVICAFALVPGLPKLPFLVVGGLFFLVGRALKDKPTPAESRAAAEESARNALPVPATPARPGARGAVDRPARAVHRLRPRAAGRRRARAGRCCSVSARSAARSRPSSARSSRPSASTTRSGSPRTSTS